MAGYVTLGVVLLGSIVMPLVRFETSIAQTNTQVVISEIQISGLDGLLIENGKNEFVEIHNQTDSQIDITGWRLQYFSSTREDVFDGNSSPTRELISLSDILDSEGYALFSYEAYILGADGYFGQGSNSTSGLLAKSGGHLRLLNDNNDVVDVVGWGTAKSPELTALPEIQAGNSAIRKPDQSYQSILQDTDNNLYDFVSTNLPSPQGGSLIDKSVSEEESVTPPCDNLTISELLPNPESVDTGKEFVELYNATAYKVFLEDCALKSSSSNKQYSFAIGSYIEPGEYKAFFDHLTGITLANAAGGEVLLIGTTTDYSVQYPADMTSDYAWALIGSIWYETTKPTPGYANALVVATDSQSVDYDSLSPCPAGKFRNPETNRCKNILIIGATLTPCRTGQVRNIETNRCRNISSLANSLVPCGAGQERNLETNRCRKIVSNSAQTECQAGYERNKETNRCRKIQATLAASSSIGQGIEATKDINYAFMAGGTAAVAGYGAYEYKRDISNVHTRLKAKARNRRMK